MLLLDLPKEQSIGVAGLIGDSESIAFSLQIAEFLKSKGYHIPEDSSAQILMQGVPPIGLSLLPPDDMHEYYTVIVGTQPE